MRLLLNQLRIRLILGALVFLLGLTGAVVLVVRDSLSFTARDMEKLGAEGLLEQGKSSLLDIARREAELSDHAIHHNLGDRTPLDQRLQSLDLTPNTYAFVIDADGKLIAATAGKAASLFEDEVASAPINWVGRSLAETTNTGLRAILPWMQSGKSNVTQLKLNNENVVVAYAPLPETGWSLAIVTPVSEITASAGTLSANIEKSVNGILKATLVTIGYFGVLVIVGSVLAARALTGPIQSLVEGTQSIAAGDLTARIQVKSSDELGVLADSFNQMVEQLQMRNSELTRTNEILSEREARLRLITEITTDALYEWDIQAGRTQWSHSYRTLFGYPAEGFHEHKWWRERVHPDDLEQAVAQLEDTFGNHKESLSFEYRYRRADGSYAYVVDRGFIFYDEKGQPVRHIGAMIDISDRVTLSEAQARAALEERQRLARELHDSVTQSLYSLTLLAEAGRRTALAGEVEKVVGNIARLGETAQQALKEMRLLVYELRPLALEQAGLADALQHRLDAVEKRAGIEARLRVDLAVELPADIENALYRVAQETLNNSLKHAEATIISIYLQSFDSQVQLKIEDNGKGFQMDEAKHQGGLGLTSIRERIEALGGTWSLFSTPGEGTTVSVNVPLKRSE